MLCPLVVKVKNWDPIANFFLLVQTTQLVFRAEQKAEADGNVILLKSYLNERTRRRFWLDIQDEEAHMEISRVFLFLI